MRPAIRWPSAPAPGSGCPKAPWPNACRADREAGAAFEFRAEKNRGSRVREQTSCFHHPGERFESTLLPDAPRGPRALPPGSTIERGAPEIENPESTRRRPPTPRPPA